MAILYAVREAVQVSYIRFKFRSAIYILGLYNQTLFRQLCPVTMAFFFATF